ncbi:MFS sugar transporter [Aspergillus niger]|nr:MFS sugar transporter [Aspergillus niger]
MKPALGFRSTKLNIGHICTVILPAYICFRYLMAVTSGIETRQSWVHTFPQMDTVNMTGSKEAENSRIKGTVTAIFNLGCLCSALSCILSSEFSLPQLTIGRLIAGFGFGGVTATGPNWQSETVQPMLRGFIAMLQSILLCTGLALAGWLEYGVAFTDGSVTWRLPLVFACFLCLGFLCWDPVWPDSVRPGWLIKKGRIDDARNVLAKLRDEPIDSPSIVHQIEQIEMTLQETGQGSFKDIFEMDQHNSPTAPSSLLRYRWATDLWGQCDNFLSIYHIRNLSWHE